MKQRGRKIVVVGAGPAGLAAAVRAAQFGCRVQLIDQSPDPGGQIWRSAGGEADPAAVPWLQRLETLGVETLYETTVIDAPRPGRLLAESGGEAVALNYDGLILATGCRELFLPFPGWTLPGVCGAGGLQALVKGGAPIAGKRVVVAGSGPLLVAVAAMLKKTGADVVLVAEQASLSEVGALVGSLFRSPSKLVQAFRLAYALGPGRYRTGCWPVRAEGKDRLEKVALRAGDKTWTEECDYLACGFGLVPNTELGSLMGCELDGGKVWVNNLQQTSRVGVFAAGEVTGIGGVELAVEEGQIAGLMAADQQRKATSFLRRKERMGRVARNFLGAYALRPELKELSPPDTVVCRCEDVSLGRLKEYADWRSAKLQTRCGMGPCQGRICGPALEFLLGWTPDSVRPPLYPVAANVLRRAGELEKSR